MTKIIELTKSKEDYQCIICCENTAEIKMKLNRLVQDDSITTLYVCDSCLAQMQKDIETVK